MNDVSFCFGTESPYHWRSLQGRRHLMKSFI